MQKDRNFLQSALPLSAPAFSALAFSAVAFSTVCMGTPALAGPNDFFGSQVPSAVGGQAQPSSSASNPYADPVVPKGDFTDDEKRMQKKYKAGIRNAHDLIARGTEMMETGQRKRNDKLFKKGKIIKEIGEKTLAELKSNNPVADMADEKKKKQTADAQTQTTQ